MNNTGLDNKYQFENFIEKDGNALAKKRSFRSSKELRIKIQSPLYLWAIRFRKNTSPASNWK